MVYCTLLLVFLGSSIHFDMRWEECPSRTSTQLSEVCFSHSLSATKDHNSHSVQGIRKFVNDLLELKRASADEMRKNVYHNYPDFIQ